MEKCLVSVIVPVYHVDDQMFLNCIKSITEQTEKRIEIIIVFDGTDLLYKEIIDDPVFGDPRLRIVNKEHRGVSAARNIGLELACGQWILFADADDCLSDNAIESLLRGAVGRADLIIADYFIKYPRKTVTHMYGKKALLISHGNKKAFLEDILNPQSGMGFCWGKLYRKTCIRMNHLRFNENLEVAEDMEFVLKFVFCAREIQYLPCAIYFYQINADSTVRKFREDYAHQYEKAMQSIFCTIMNTDYGTCLKAAYETCVLYHLLLITVNYAFHPDHQKKKKQKITEYKILINKSIYSEAIRKGNSSKFSFTRRITVWLIRLHLWNGVCAVAWLRHKQLQF